MRAHVCRSENQSWPSRGRQVSHHRWLPGFHSMQAAKHESDGSALALKPRTDITRSPKQEYQWLHIKQQDSPPAWLQASWRRLGQDQGENQGVFPRPKTGLGGTPTGNNAMHYGKDTPINRPLRILRNAGGNKFLQKFLKYTIDSSSWNEVVYQIISVTNVVTNASHKYLQEWYYC